MKLPWIVVIVSSVLSGCGDIESQTETNEQRVESDLELLVAEFNEVLRSEPEFIHGPSEMRAEYEELKRKSEIGTSKVTEEELSDFLTFIEKSEAKAERLKSLRMRIMAISEGHPDIRARATSRLGQIETENQDRDPFQ